MYKYVVKVWLQIYKNKKYMNFHLDNSRNLQEDRPSASFNMFFASRDVLHVSPSWKNHMSNKFKPANWGKKSSRCRSLLTVTFILRSLKKNEPIMPPINRCDSYVYLPICLARYGPHLWTQFLGKRADFHRAFLRSIHQKSEVVIGHSSSFFAQAEF